MGTSRPWTQRTWLGVPSVHKRRKATFLLFLQTKVNPDQSPPAPPPPFQGQAGGSLLTGAWSHLYLYGRAHLALNVCLGVT